MVNWPARDFPTIRADIDGHVLAGARGGARFRCARARGPSRGEVVRHGGRARLLPQAVWQGMGARRRRRATTGIRSPHRASATRSSTPRRSRRRSSAGLSGNGALDAPTGRTRSGAQRTRAADVRVHHASGSARAPAAGDASPLRCAARQPGRHERVPVCDHRRHSAADFMSTENIGRIMAAASEAETSSARTI